MNDSLKTPLYDFHAEQGGRFVPFAGWLMPVQFTSIIEEHLAVRNGAGFFDVSHMGEALISGSSSEKFLDFMITNRVADLPIGKAVYSPMCYPDGGVVDDLIIYRTAEESFLICLNASNVSKDIEWMQKHVPDFDCEVYDVSARYAQIAVQGPRAESLLAPLVAGVALKSIKRFHFVETPIAGSQALLARTGYTGEDGFEIYCCPENATSIASSLLRAGVKPCGLGARDSLRLEAGYPLYGHEISETISPLQGGIAWTVKLGKASGFIGKEALKKEKEDGPGRRLLHFIINDRRIARQETEVFCGDEVVGMVVSGTMSPVLKKAIGAALVQTDRVDLNNLHVFLRGTKLKLECRKPPLHKIML